MPIKPRRDNIDPKNLANCRVGHIAPKKADGNGCAECHRIFQIEWRKKNKEKARKSVQAWRDNNPEHTRAYTKAWTEKNPEYRRESNERFYRENREREKARTRKYYYANLEKAKGWAHKRIARVKAAHGSHTPEDLKEIFKVQKGRCAYCKIALRKLPTRERHLDHIIPIARGGSNDRSNLQLTCGSCNLRKNKKDPIVFAQQLGRLL